MKCTAKELRRRARAALEHHYSPAVSLTFSLTLFTLALTLLLQSSSLSVSPLLYNQVLYWILFFIVLLLKALLETGLVRYIYSLCRQQPLKERGPLFYAFRRQPDTFILCYGFRYLVCLVWFVPAAWFYMQLPLVIDLTAIPPALPRIVGLMLICGLAACIPALICSLPWCLATYVLLDQPDASASEALKTSRCLMHGQWGRVFRLWLGFVPLYLLGVGSLGAGFLWIRPYFHASMAHLYLELQEEHSREF